MSIRQYPIWVVVVTLAMVLLLGCTAESPAPADSPSPTPAVEPKPAGPPSLLPGVTMPPHIRVAGTSGSGGLSDLHAAWTFQTLQRAFPQSTIRNMMVTDKDIIMRLDDRSCDIGTAAYLTAVCGYQGWEPLFKKRYPRIALLGGFEFANAIHIAVLKESDITDISDLKARGRLGVGPVTGIGGYYVDVMLLEGYDFGYEYMKARGREVDRSAFDEACQLMAAGRLDAVVYPLSFPYSGFVQLNDTHGIRILKWNEMALEGWRNRFPGHSFPIEIPANTYKGQDEPIKSVSLATATIVRSDWPEDVVYNICSVLWDDDIARTRWQVYPAWKGLDSVAYAAELVRAANRTADVPVHPGALRYWGARGLSK